MEMRKLNTDEVRLCEKSITAMKKELEHWEPSLPAPATTGQESPGSSGPPSRRRLNPLFVAWLMGHHWLMKPTLLENRVDYLRLMGNAVVPPQAATAFRELAKRIER